MSKYNHINRDVFGRLYLHRRPCQPRGHAFSWKGKVRNKWCFIENYFDDFSLLGCSVSKDSTFCLHYYLYSLPSTDQAFISRGFSNFIMRKRFSKHERDHLSFHHLSMLKCHSLMNEKTHIAPIIEWHSLGASIEVIRLLLQQSLAFHWHDESKISITKITFLRF